MKKEQSLGHLIVTEMPYELLTLLIEKKALDRFITNTIAEASSLNDLVQKSRITLLMKKPVPKIIISAFNWSNVIDTGFLNNLYKESLNRVLK